MLTSITNLQEHRWEILTCYLQVQKFEYFQSDLKNQPVIYL